MPSNVQSCIGEFIQSDVFAVTPSPPLMLSSVSSESPVQRTLWRRDGKDGSIEGVLSANSSMSAWTFAPPVMRRAPFEELMRTTFWRVERPPEMWISPVFQLQISESALAEVREEGEEEEG